MAVVDRPVTKPRPVYLNLFAIRLPLPGLVSILHRVSGALLFVPGIPLLLCALQIALSGPEMWGELRGWFLIPWVKLLAIGLTWAYLHHLFAGARHLVMDLHIGMDLAAARQSSALVLVLPLLLTLVVAVRLW